MSADRQSSASSAQAADRGSAQSSAAVAIPLMMLLTLGTAVPIAMREFGRRLRRNAARKRRKDERDCSLFQGATLRCGSGGCALGSVSGFSMPNGGLSRGVKKVVLAYSGGLDTSII